MREMLNRHDNEVIVWHDLDHVIGKPLDSEHPQRVEGVVIPLVGPRRELSGQAMTAVERAGANEGLYGAASILT